MQLGVLLIVARSLGPEGSGAFAIALLVPTFMAKFLNLGIVAANVYYVASERFSLVQVWASSRDLILFVALVGTALAVALIMSFGERVLPGIERMVLLSALLIFPFSLIASLVIGIFQALQDFRSFNIAFLMQPSIALCGVFSVWIMGASSLPFILFAMVVSHLLAMLGMLLLLSRKLPLMAVTEDRLAYLRPALSYGGQAHFSNILTFLNYRLDLFLVNFFLGPAAAGIYTVAIRLVEQLWMVSQAVSIVIFPRLSAIYGTQTDKNAYTPILARSVMWLTLLGSVALALIADPLIDFLFGPEFALANPALLILLPGIILFSCGRVLANDVAARGLVTLNLALAGLVLIINTIANLILIPQIGLIGAAIATTIAYTVSFLMSIIIQHHIAGTRWTAFVFLSLADLKLLLRILRNRK